MKKYLALLSVLISAVAFAISIDVDLLKSPDHTKVWTPPSTSTTLVGRDTVDNLSNKTLDKLVSTSEQNNNTVTGANAVMTTPTSLVVQVSNGSLTSIDGVTAPSDNQIFVLKNKTGSNVTINNETGVNTTYRIKTGTGANLVMATDSAIILSYSITDSRWQVIGGSGSGSGSGISSWVTANGYLTGDLVIQSNKIYQAQSDHTSGTFATDLSGGKWAEISAPQDLTGPISSTSGVTSITSQTGTGTKFVVDTSPTIVTPTISGHPTVEGVTATGATGTGNFVFDTSPTLVTPTLGVATATSINGTTIPSSKTLQDKDTLTAKGDLYVATASATTARQAVGSNTQVLTVDSSQTNGIKWADSQILTKSEVEGADVSTVKIITPNAQLTTTSTGIRRLETSNTNLMLNPSFEASIVSTDHTLTNATAANDTTNKTDGAKGIAVTVTSSGGGISQTSTTNAASLAGSQGVVKASVYTTGTDVYVCPLMAGSPPSDITKYCGNVPRSTTSVKMPEVIVPFIMDGTSNGYKIYSTGTSAFTADEVLVGKAAPFQSVNGAKLVGTVTISGCTSTFNLTSVTFTDFGANTNCVYTTTGSAVADTSFGTTQIPSIKFASLPAGDYSIQVEGSFYQSNTNQNGYLRISDGTNISRETSEFTSSAGGIIVPSINHTISYSTTQSNVTLKLQGASTSSNLSIFANGTLGNSNGSSSRHLTFKVYYFPPESRIYSQTSIGAQSAYAYGTPAAYSANAPIIFPTKGNDTYNTYSTSTGQYTCPANGYYNVTANVGSNNYPADIYISKNGSTSGANTVNIAATYISTVPRASGSGTIYCAKNDTLDIRQSTSSGSVSYGSVTFTLVASDNPITGSFAGIEKCANDYECTDTFSATISSGGVVSNENLDWINGNAVFSPTGTATITLNTNLKDGTSSLVSPMNCVATADGSVSTNYIARIISSSTTTVVVGTQSGTGTNNNSGFKIKCQKGTNDYKPKTAKVATSIDVPLVTGLTTPIIRIASINCHSSSSVTIPSGMPTWISLSNYSGTSTSGSCTATLSGFTQTPYCTFGAASGNRQTSFNAGSSTSATAGCYSGGGNCGVNDAYQVICIGK